MRRVLSVFLPLWPLERAARAVAKAAASSSAGQPPRERNQRSGDFRHDPVAPLEVAVDSSQVGHAWKHPRTIAAAWTGVADAPEHLMRPHAPSGNSSPLLMVGISRGVQTVVAACPRAVALGVSVGMTLAHARAQCAPSAGRTSAMQAGGSCTVMDSDPAADRAALRRLAAWLLRYVPSVALPHDSSGRPDRCPDRCWHGCWDGLWGDLTGCERLLDQRFGGERPFLHALHERLRRNGITARLAIAGTAGAAWGLARHGADPIVSIAAGTELDALRPLPLAALRLAESDIQALHEVHVTTVQHFLDLDRAELAERVGRPRGSRAPNSRQGSPRSRGASSSDMDEGEVLVPAHAGASSASAALGRDPKAPDPLMRLDQALGRLPEPLACIRLAPACRVERTFAGPVTDPEAISLAVADLLDALCRRLRRRERGARRLQLIAVRADAPAVTIDLHLGRASRRRGHLWTLLRPALERLDAGFGIDTLVLTAPRTAVLPHRELAHRELGHRELGHRELGHGELAHGDAAQAALSLPVTALAPSPAADECLDRLAARLGAHAIFRIKAIETHEPEAAFALATIGEDERSRIDQAIVHSLPTAERPTIVWSPPEPIEVIDGIGDPRNLRWRGRNYSVLASGGDECISERWWRMRAAAAHSRVDPVLASRTRHYRRLLLDIGVWLWVWHTDDAPERWWAQGAWG